MEGGTQGATQFSSFGRLALDPRKLVDVLLAAKGMITAPPKAAQSIWENYRPGAENEPLNQDIGRQGATASSAMSPGVLRGGKGEIGSMGGRGVSGRRSPQAVAEEMAKRGDSADEIARVLTAYYSEPGKRVTAADVVGMLEQAPLANPRIASPDMMRDLGKMAREDMARPHTEIIQAFRERYPNYPSSDKALQEAVVRARKIARLEAGQHGDARRKFVDAPKEYNFTPEQLVEQARRSELLAKTVGSGDTQYVRIVDPKNPKVPPLEVRFPSDAHTGNVHNHRRDGDFIDLGTQRPRKAGGGKAMSPAYVRKNEAGEPFTEWPVLTDAIKERWPGRAPPGENWLTPPGSGVRGRQKPEPAPEPAPPPHPDQLKLLSGGIGPWYTQTHQNVPFSAPDISPWAATVTPAGPGGWETSVFPGTPPMFMNPDTNLAIGTERLTGQVGGAADALESELPSRRLAMMAALLRGRN